MGRQSPVFHTRHLKERKHPIAIPNCKLKITHTFCSCSHIKFILFEKQCHITDNINVYSFRTISHSLCDFVCIYYKQPILMYFNNFNEFAAICIVKGRIFEWIYRCTIWIHIHLLCSCSYYYQFLVESFCISTFFFFSLVHALHIDSLWTMFENQDNHFVSAMLKYNMMWALFSLLHCDFPM